jgi:tetratricopeptide (TPR) repeat protein
MEWYSVKNKITTLAKNEKYNDALKELLKAEKTISNTNYPDFFVLKGVLILFSDTNDFKLEDVEKNYLKALKLDPENINALEELYHFYDAVMDDEAKAKKYMKKLDDVINDRRMEFKRIKRQISSSKLAS